MSDQSNPDVDQTLADKEAEREQRARDAAESVHELNHPIDGAEATSDSTDPAATPAGDVTHDSNQLRAEQYERAKTDPVYAAQQAIEVADEDKDEAAWQPQSAPLYGTEVYDEPTDDSDGEV